MVILPDLEAGDGVHRKTVEATFRHFHVDDRKPSDREVLGPAWLGPQQHLPLRHDSAAEFARDTGCPWSDGQHKRASFITAAIRRDPHGAATRIPVNQPFTAMNFGAGG